MKLIAAIKCQQYDFARELYFQKMTVFEDLIETIFAILSRSLLYISREEIVAFYREVGFEEEMVVSIENMIELMEEIVGKHS